jgi:hypothetical protein
MPGNHFAQVFSNARLTSAFRNLEFSCRRRVADVRRSRRGRLALHLDAASGLISLLFLPRFVIPFLSSNGVALRCHLTQLQHPVRSGRRRACAVSPHVPLLHAGGLARPNSFASWTPYSERLSGAKNLELMAHRPRSITTRALLGGALTDDLPMRLTRFCVIARSRTCRLGPGDAPASAALDPSLRSDDAIDPNGESPEPTAFGALQRVAGLFLPPA